MRVGLDACLLFWMAQRLFPQRESPRPVHKKIWFYLGFIIITAAVCFVALLPSLLGKIVLLPLVIYGFLFLIWRIIFNNAERDEAVEIIERFRQKFLPQGTIHE